MARFVLTDSGARSIPDGEGLWLDATECLAATGWEAKPEGMCRGEICIPLPSAMRRGNAVDVAAFWRLIEAPAVPDSTGTVWSLGVAARERRQALESLDAPDFELPDLAGQPHRLADLRGNKVLLVTWASW